MSDVFALKLMVIETEEVGLDNISIEFIRESNVLYAIYCPKDYLVLTTSNSELWLVQKNWNQTLIVGLGWV